MAPGIVARTFKATVFAVPVPQLFTPDTDIFPFENPELKTMILLVVPPDNTVNPAGSVQL